MRSVLSVFVWYFWIRHVMAGNFNFTYNSKLELIERLYKEGLEEQKRSMYSSRHVYPPVIVGAVAQRCKEHVSLHGYSYETFYRVSKLHKTAHAAFEMHLAILAASNGHILLSSTSHPDSEDPVYEIVIGGGGNKFTELRRNIRRNARFSVKTDNILSAIEYRAFFIRISEDGVIEFGKEGDAVPLIVYNDVNPVIVNYFSFASWNGVEARFLYDCPAPGSNNTIAPDSTPVEPKLSSSEALKRTLMMAKRPDLPPAPEVDIKLDMRITSVKFNTYDSKLTTGIAMVLVWTDNSIAWFPDKFNGTKVLKFRQGQIWSPTFFVFNADSDMGRLDSKNPELITVASTGEATYHFQTTIDTFCHDDIDVELKKRWPNDEFTCSILIGAWQPHEKFTLHALKAKENRIKMFADIDDIIQNEWDLNVTTGIVPITVWNELFTPMDNETHQSDRLLISLDLKRRATALNIVFYTPLLVLVTFVLLSFWDEPLQMSRVWFYAGCSVAISAGLCYVNYLLPCHTVPTILILYTTVLMGVLIALLIQVLLMTAVVERLCKTLFIQSLLTAKWFRAVFGLPVMKTCRNYDSINEAYASQEDDDDGAMISPRNGAVEEMQPEANKYGEKEELAEALDKLFFVVYSVTFAIMLALHY